jgi:uncharacterized protein (DUF362 family)
MEEFEPLSTQTGIGKVHLLKTSDREAGVRGLLGRFELDEYAGKRVALKANFNSADPFPASTHLDTLGAIVKVLREAGAGEIILAERSGMGDTRKVLEEMGVFDLSKELGFEVVVLDEVPKEDWAKIEGEGNHWLRGFYIARVFLEADRVIQTCCLKTHRFGGHFTLSLKNSVGMVAKRVPGGLYNYMWELHGSPHQRRMIAEINQHYDCDLVVMDGLKAFVDQGPEKGELVEPGLLLASCDRVAIDAVGIAVLRKHGSTKNVMKGKIFELEQIARAAELGVGVKAASDIEVVPLDEGSRGAAEELRGILENQG